MNGEALKADMVDFQPIWMTIRKSHLDQDREEEEIKDNKPQENLKKSKSMV